MNLTFCVLSRYSHLYGSSLGDSVGPFYPSRRGSPVQSPVTGEGLSQALHVLWSGDSSVLHAPASLATVTVETIPPS